MEAFLVSVVLVALGEIGDKTQLLALLLAARFRLKAPIIAGIAVATLANHTLAGLLGAAVRKLVPASGLRWILAASFVAMAIWALKPDKADGERGDDAGALKVFAVTVGTFFMAEMGDKTQIATVALAAQFANTFAVVAGTTIGMLVADVPVVWLGRAIAQRIPLRVARLAAAAVFLALAALALLLR